MATATRLTTPPTAPGRLPLIGHALAMWRRPLEFLDSLTAYDQIVAIYLGPTPTYVLAGPEVVDRVMVADAGHFAKGRSFEKLRDYLGEGLATSEGSYHLRQRRLMQPAFHHRQIDHYARTMARLADQRVASWQAEQVIDVTQEMFDLSLAIVTSTLFSTTLNEHIAADIRHDVPVVLRGVYNRAIDPTGLWQKLPTPGNRRLTAAHDRLRQAIDHLIRTRRAGLPTEQPDLLSMLLQAQDTDSGNTMTDQQVYDELITLLVAGTETAAGGLAWLFHELGRNPAVDRELHEELRTRSGGAPSFEQLGHLPYTQRVVDEALRVRNPGGVTLRRATTEVELAGYRFPPGAEFMFSALVLHRNPHHFHDPLRFDPDRWLPGQKAAPRGAFLPFGAGKHRCIGEMFARAEMTTVVAALASRWHLEPLPWAQVRGVMTSTNHPANLLMKAIPREVR
ncbi:cytochrome P450 [Streptomyces sp. FIT100]|uniref:cytochrome P450 n=1 Tax=Streptomyces sp. FIT100 TaxID=2837956 RepID=UPI0021C57222|nr:cytochrome P450 [Streptomyces sp. FIT100]UUN28820.1 cytochrome P450 [Streptomyces sp. FIT100]